MPVRSVLLAAALAVTGVSVAQAQSPWPGSPSSAPQAASPAPWPSAAGSSAPGPAAASSGPAPWPSAAPGGPAPFPSGPGPGAGMSPFPQRQPPAVCNDFVPIKEAAEKGGMAIRAATQRKAPPPELCPLFRSYNATEGKMLKFMTDNKTTCNVPDQIIQQVKTSFAKTAQITKQVCNPQAAAPGGRKPQTLGDALGTPQVPTGENTKTGLGTFNTLSGSNPLAR